MGLKARKTNMFLDIQQYVYQSLKANKELSKDLQIFSQIPKDTPFPYLYLGKFIVINRSLKELIKMYFVNEIHLYSQDHSTEEILNWVSEIKNTLQLRNISLGKCHINEIEFLQMNLDIMSDAKTHRVIGKFRIIVEENYGSTKRIFDAA
jgi:hypothetical protein